VDSRLRSHTAAGTGDINMLRVNSSDLVDFRGGAFLMSQSDFYPNSAGARSLGAAYPWNVIHGTKVYGEVNVVAFSATPIFDASLGNTQKITLTNNVTSSTVSNASAGQTINFLICQDGTGSRTFVWPTNVKGGVTIGSTLSTCNAQNFIFDGTNAYALSSGVINM
jgi:hypothetical protein